MTAQEEADNLWGECEAPPDTQQGEPNEEKEVAQETGQPNCLLDLP